MADHSLGEVYDQVVEVKRKLEAGGGIATQAYINEKFKEHKGGGVTKEYLDEKFKSAKEDPTQAEQWAKVIGADGVVKAIQDFKISSLASLSALGAVLVGFLVSTIVDKDLLTVAALKKFNLARDERGIPRSIPRETPTPARTTPQSAPVSSIDIDRLKSMRSASIALSRSLSDLTKEVTNAARQIA
ncbi:hypothetical protein [Streptomyces liangshanensis]|uniref:Uncharacterized protein n=1 Tax=Streptomyces liangshanensis TaxID=2717324 RepID=A0A6G9H388_9ACTN|nr:hypothetical protein [Streptomyces liangshanensis]QIQ04691.1 hypothetical protein HA039_22530 [Streptomyces liangshanensis]